MTKGPCAMRGLLHGPLVSNRSAWPAGNPREVRGTALRRFYWTAAGHQSTEFDEALTDLAALAEDLYCDGQAVLALLAKPLVVQRGPTQRSRPPPHGRGGAGITQGCRALA